VRSALFFAPGGYSAHGQRDAAGRAAQQPRADVFFERDDRAADRRRRQPQLPRRGREAACVGHGHENPHPFESIHLGIPRSEMVKRPPKAFRSAAVAAKVRSLHMEPSMTPTPRPAHPIRLHTFSLSGHAHRVELFLSLLGLPFE